MHTTVLCLVGTVHASTKNWEVGFGWRRNLCTTMGETGNKGTMVSCKGDWGPHCMVRQGHC